MGILLNVKRWVLSVVVFGLVAWSGVAGAETIAATQSGSTSPVYGYSRNEFGVAKWYRTVAGICGSMNITDPGKGYYATTNENYPSGCCSKAVPDFSGQCFGPGSQVLRCSVPDGSNVVFPVGGVCAASYTCPEGQNWTLSGQTCTRPDCAAYQTRDAATGVCGCPAGKTDSGTACVTVCPSGYHNAVPDNGQCIENCVGRQTQGADGACKCAVAGGVVTTTWAAVKDRCIGGCESSWSAGVANPVDVAKFLAGSATASQVTSYSYVRFTGATCSPPSTLIPANIEFVQKDTSGKAADGVTPDAKNTPETNQSPDACAAVGGSFGVFNGVSKCLTDTANSMQKLTVDKKTATTVNPDGTRTEVTDTTYKVKDPITGEVVTKTDSTTVQKNAQGVVTGTGTGSAQGSESSNDFCKNNSGLDFCQNRLNKETTQVEVRDYLASLTNPGDTPFTSLENAKEKQEATDVLKAENDKQLDFVKGVTVPDAAEKTAWQAAMSASWFEPLQPAACAPVTWRIGGRDVLNLDICKATSWFVPVAEWAMWLMLGWSVFVTLTGGSRKET